MPRAQLFEVGGLNPLRRISKLSFRYRRSIAAVKKVQYAAACCQAAQWSGHCQPDARAFERHQRANVRVFILGQGRRDDSVDSIIVVGSDGIARGDVHRGCRCAAAVKDNADGDADNIVC